MKQYEAVFILDERRFDDAGEAFSKDVVRVIEELGGKLISLNPMGRRQFARPIRKQHAGIYLDFILEMEPGKVAELKDRYRLNESVIRLVVVSYTEPPKRGDVREADLSF